MTSQRPQDWRYILEDSGAKCLFVSTKKIYHETFHFAGVHGNVRSVFCFEQPSGQRGSFTDLLQANVGECCILEVYRSSHGCFFLPCMVVYIWNTFLEGRPLPRQESSVPGSRLF